MCLNNTDNDYSIISLLFNKVEVRNVITLKKINKSNVR